MNVFTVSWSQLATLIGALVAIQGAFAYHMDRRFSDLHRYLDARFKGIEDRLTRLEDRVGRLEDRLEHPLVR